MSEVAAEKIVCKQCGFEFKLSEEEANRYLEKGLEKPKRCHRCRQQNLIAKMVKEEVTKQLAEMQNA